jgi:hypothetical protein
VTVRIKKVQRRSSRPVVGWREWVALPRLGVNRIKAKVDSGARSSALHAFNVQTLERDGRTFVRFDVHPWQRDTHRTVTVEHVLDGWRWVRSSSGHRTLRPVIITELKLMGRTWPIELTLIGRDEMGFRLLLGRQALHRRCLIDPTRSYLTGKPPKKSRRAGKIKRTRQE